MTTNALTTESLKLFLELAKDSGNWAGAPMIGGNVQVGPARRGNLTDLKKNGLVTTWTDDDCTFVEFTEAGIAFAAANGCPIRGL